MTQDPLSRVHPPRALSPRQEQQETSIQSPGNRAGQSGINDILRTLAAHGAGTASAELAFDLVLHEIAEDARQATQATGAAIAWLRDGEMVCRATTGENAPNLGVRLDIRSGLAGACADTGKIQNCQDTGTDSRVNAEACRQLGVRSTLVAPISMPREILGILQLYSSKPNAFGDSEIRVLEAFIHRSIDAWLGAQAGGQSLSDEPDLSHLAVHDMSDEAFEHTSRSEKKPSVGHQASPRTSKEFTNSILLVAVLVVAITLGLTLGWRWGREQVSGTSGSRSGPQPPIVLATPSESFSQAATGSGPAVLEKSIGSAQNADGSVSGTTRDDLVISQDGKVIYRSINRPSNSAPYRMPMRKETMLVRRVDPDYPPAALSQHVQGPVVLDVKVLPEGDVSDVVVRSGDPLLREAAIEAVRQWRFQPTAVAGAADRQIRVTIRFTLPTNE